MAANKETKQERVDRYFPAHATRADELEGAAVALAAKQKASSKPLAPNASLDQMLPKHAKRSRAAPPPSRQKIEPEHLHNNSYINASTGSAVHMY